MGDVLAEFHDLDFLAQTFSLFCIWPGNTKKHHEITASGWYHGLTAWLSVHRDQQKKQGCGVGVLCGLHAWFGNTPISDKAATARLL